MSFILALTAAGMFYHLVTVRQPVKGRKWLVGFYLGLCIWQLENVFRYSMLPGYIGSTAYKIEMILILIPALSLTLICHTQYVYRFLVDLYERERRLVLRISIFLFLAEVSFVAWNELTNKTNAVYITRLSAFLYSSIFTIWIIILALRKSRLLHSINHRASKAHFIYAGINACYVAGSLISLVFGFFSGPGFWSYFLFVWFGNLASIVLYIVTSAVPASFQTKVTGFTFVLAATVLCIITLAFYPPDYAADMSVQLAQQTGLKRLMMITAVVAFLIVLLMPFMLKISLVKPLQRLIVGIEKVNAGNLDTQVTVGLRDEIGILTLNFNRMTQSLKKAQDDLTEYAQTLEKKVAKRTEQLQKSFNELRSTQAQLIQTEKMASLGELTAGIAHEIKNPLNFINNFSELSAELTNELKEEINKPTIDKENINDLIDNIHQMLEKINHHGIRASGIVTNMLEHSRASKGVKELTDINQLISEYLSSSYEEMLLKNKNFHAVVEKKLDPEIKKVNIIPQDVGRVFLNLFNNAFYSVTEKKKKLNGALSPGQAGFEPKLFVQTKTNGEVIEIHVRDNGMGIPDDILDKIYQPFFTTKPTGQGTGLGLSLSYDIITKGYNGEFKVNTSEGEFAEFTITLPVDKL
jgi:signal transduction histidine kinase